MNKTKIEFKELKANLNDLRNEGWTPEEIKGAMKTLPTMFDTTPDNPELLKKLLDDYKEWAWTVFEDSLDDEKPGVPICMYADDESRDRLMDYLDQHWDGETDWAEIYPIIKNDNVLVNRYWAFVQDFVK